MFYQSQYNIFNDPLIIKSGHYNLLCTIISQNLSQSKYIKDVTKIMTDLMLVFEFQLFQFFNYGTTKTYFTALVLTDKSDDE